MKAEEWDWYERKEREEEVRAGGVLSRSAGPSRIDNAHHQRSEEEEAAEEEEEEEEERVFQTSHSLREAEPLAIGGKTSRLYSGKENEAMTGKERWMDIDGGSESAGKGESVLQQIVWSNVQHEKLVKEHRATITSWSQ
ncbi:unnamed protein product [Pleuronectes platessa]|uniref:Uncharacterized protein n=1 Tax=Pleuronectes platessa TaxID=8262 RepID=A0A9N7UMU7_PLEPL|nr:unnamed protein product [Pleuronectes platessa]